ncbi:MAG: hypothetical protein AAFU55_04350 [Pseudomonadota bacterium]
MIPLMTFRAPKSLMKRVKRGDYEITVDRDFEGVIERRPQRMPAGGAEA